MSKTIRERFPALSLGELHKLAEDHRDSETIIRLLWEIRALHVVAYNAWRVETEHYFVYPDNPQGVAYSHCAGRLNRSAGYRKWWIK